MQLLGNVGGANAPAIAEVLADGDPGVRQQAVYALHQAGGQADAVVPVLAKVYKNGDAQIRSLVFQVVWRYGAKAKDLILDGIKDKDANVRVQAVNSLQNLQGDLSEMIPTLTMLMKDKELGIRQQLVWLFQRTGEKGVPHVAELLKDPDQNVRMQAAQVLRNLGPRAAKAGPALKDAIKDANAGVRLNALLALTAIGGDGPEIVAKHFSEEKDANTRANLLQNLAYSNNRQLALPLLKTAIKDPAPQVRQTVINVVRLYGNTKEALEIFELALKDTDVQVGTNAAYLAAMYGSKAWTPLEEALKSTKNSGFRAAILQGMQQSQYKSKTSVPILIECLKDILPNVRQAACNVLGNIGPDAAAALPALQELTNDSVPFVQNAARSSIQRIDAKKK
jgi:HEAT repeat protein